MVAKEKERDNTDSSALWMGWIGIIAGIIAFFLFTGSVWLCCDNSWFDHRL